MFGYIKISRDAIGQALAKQTAKVFDSAKDKSPRL